VDDPAHKTARCMEPCDRVHACGLHPCSRLCYEECGPCLQPIPEPTLLPCGHIATDLPCHKYVCHATGGWWGIAFAADILSGCVQCQHCSAMGRAIIPVTMVADSMGWRL
jgi:hypothetical protein